ncbi:hypothetical protein ABH899_005686, partial [Paenibacillus sp. RC84]
MGKMLATLKTAKRYMGIAEDDMSQDLVILPALMAATKSIEREANRSFERKIYRQTLDGPGTQFLRLRHFPVHDVLRLSVGGKDVALDTFTIESENGMLFRRSGWPCGTRTVEVEYLAGY